MCIPYHGSNKRWKLKLSFSDKESCRSAKMHLTQRSALLRAELFANLSNILGEDAPDTPNTVSYTRTPSKSGNYSPQGAQAQGTEKQEEKEKDVEADPPVPRHHSISLSVPPPLVVNIPDSPGTSPVSAVSADSAQAKEFNPNSPPPLPKSPKNTENSIIED